MQLDLTFTAPVILIAVTACVFDMRTRRIPNALNFGAALAGLLVHWLTGGSEGAMEAAGGWVVGQIQGSDDEALEMTVFRFAGTRGLVDPTPGEVVRVPLDLVIRIDDEYGATR